MFFGPHRAAFLGFLRNLSPQVLLLAIALVASSRLDMHRFDWSVQGIKNVLPFALIMLVFLGAMVANVTLFLDEIGVRSERVASTVRRAKAGVQTQGGRGGHLRLFMVLVAATWRHDRSGLLRFAAAFLVVEIGLVGLFLTALPAASALTNLLHPPVHAVIG